MSSCIECGSYTKYKNGVCKPCFQKRVDRGKQTKNETQTEFKTGVRYPSHTELYRDLYVIEKELAAFLLSNYLGKLYNIHLTDTKHEIVIEENSWDIIVSLSGINAEFVESIENRKIEKIERIENDIKRIEKNLQKDTSFVEDMESRFLASVWRKSEVEESRNNIKIYKKRLSDEKKELSNYKDAYFSELVRLLGMSETLQKAKKKFSIFIEYKSSINEWGKQIDQHFRQIKSKIKMQGIERNNDFVCLMSFDSTFDEYINACKHAGLDLVVLPQSILYVLQGKDKQEKMKRKEELTITGNKNKK